MASIICGSIAIDTILNFEGNFADQILPDQIHKLSVSFFTPSMRREFGGCAGNIAYALHQLGGVALPVAAVGPDARDYMERFTAMGIDTSLIMVRPDNFTALCTILTDKINNQINGFHPGAMSEAHLNDIPTRADAKIGIISPDGKEAMWVHAHQFKAAGVPFIFDPGQQLPMFNGEEHRELIHMADYVAVNDYEGAMLSERTGWSLADMSHHVKGLIVTLGEQGCDIWVQGQKTRVAPVKALKVVDPTGCGDAFRAALLFGIENGWDLVRSCQLGNQVGAFKIAHRGCQNYQLDRASLGLAN